MEIKYFKNLDGLRAIAAFSVIVAHFFTSARVDSPFIIKLAAQGNSGVSLFFVLSGFVITRILLKSINSQHYFKTFYIRRTLRIFPLYYFALLCYYFVPVLLNLTDSVPTFGQQAYYYGYLQNFARTFGWNAAGPGHFWSLAVEEHFYLIWPAIVYFAFKKHTKPLLIISIVLIAAVFALRYLMLSDGYDIDVFTFTRLDQLVLGGILALLERNGYLTLDRFKVYASLIVIGVISVAACGLLNDFYLNLFKHNAFGVLYFGIIAAIIIRQEKNWVNGFLTFPTVQYLGTISYGVYVWHRLIIDIVDAFLKTDIVILDFFIVVGLTIVVSAISYKILEAPFLKLKKYFSYA